MLKALRRNSKARQEAERLYAAIVAQARAPEFYAALGVADTLDGRFDMIVLHAWLVLARLKALDDRDISQSLTNILFERFDEGLRELGAGDMGMGRKMTKLANAFYGRMEAYGAAIQGGSAALQNAILRNIYRGMDGRTEDAGRITAYVLRAWDRIAVVDLRETEPAFGRIL